MIDIFNHKNDDVIVYRLHHKGLHFANVVQLAPRKWQMELVGIVEPLILKSKKDCIQYAREYIQQAPPLYTHKKRLNF